MVVKIEKKNYMYSIGIITASLLISLLVIFFVIKPLYKSEVRTSKEVKENKEILNALENKLVKLKELKSKEEELKAEKEKVLAALPEDKEISRLFVQFEKMISDTGATVESAKEGSSSLAATTGAESTDKVNISGIKKYDYDIKFNTSTYESFKNTIANLEKALRLVNLSSLSIETKDNTFSLGLGLNAYSRETSVEGGGE